LTGTKTRKSIAVPAQPHCGLVAARSPKIWLVVLRSLGVREHQSAFLQDAVFGGQIFVPGQQLSPQKMYRNASGTAMLTADN
jgi:hypothetical protein